MAKPADNQEPMYIRLPSGQRFFIPPEYHSTIDEEETRNAIMATIARLFPDDAKVLGIESRPRAGVIGQVGSQLETGIYNLGSSIEGMADLVTGDTNPDDWGMRERASDNRLEYTPKALGQRARKTGVGELSGIGEAFQVLSESAVPTAANMGAGIAAGAMTGNPVTGVPVAIGVTGALEAAQSAGSSYGDQVEYVKQMANDPKSPIFNDPKYTKKYREYLTQTGDETKAREMAVADVARDSGRLAGGTAGGLTALGTLTTAGVANKVAGPVVGNIAGKIANKTKIPKGVSRAALVGGMGASESAEEFLQSGGEQFGANLGRRQVNPDQDLLEGVPNAALQGSIVGGMGGIAMGSGLTAADIYTTNENRKHNQGLEDSAQDYQDRAAGAISRVDDVRKERELRYAEQANELIKIQERADELVLTGEAATRAAQEAEMDGAIPVRVEPAPVDPKDIKLAQTSFDQWAHKDLAQINKKIRAETKGGKALPESLKTANKKSTATQSKLKKSAAKVEEAAKAVQDAQVALKQTQAERAALEETKQGAVGVSSSAVRVADKLLALNKSAEEIATKKLEEASKKRKSLSDEYGRQVIVASDEALDLRRAMVDEGIDVDALLDKPQRAVGEKVVNQNELAVLFGNDESVTEETAPEEAPAKPAKVDRRKLRKYLDAEKTQEEVEADRVERETKERKLPLTIAEISKEMTKEEAEGWKRAVAAYRVAAHPDGGFQTYEGKVHPQGEFGRRKPIGKRYKSREAAELWAMDQSNRDGVDLLQYDDEKIAALTKRNDDVAKAQIAAKEIIRDEIARKIDKVQIAVREELKAAGLDPDIIKDLSVSTLESDYDLALRSTNDMSNLILGEFVARGEGPSVMGTIMVSAFNVDLNAPLEKQREQLRGVFRHELGHALKEAGMITPAEYKSMVSLAKRRKFQPDGKGKLPVTYYEAVENNLVNLSKRAWNERERARKQQAIDLKEEYEIQPFEMPSQELLEEEAVMEMIRMEGFSASRPIGREARGVIDRIVRLVKAIISSFKSPAMKDFLRVTEDINSGRLSSRMRSDVLMGFPPQDMQQEIRKQAKTPNGFDTGYSLFSPLNPKLDNGKTKTVYSWFFNQPYAAFPIRLKPREGDTGLDIPDDIENEFFYYYDIPKTRLESERDSLGPNTATVTLRGSGPAVFVGDVIDVGEGVRAGALTLREADRLANTLIVSQNLPQGVMGGLMNRLSYIARQRNESGVNRFNDADFTYINQKDGSRLTGITNVVMINEDVTSANIGQKQILGNTLFPVLMHELTHVTEQNMASWAGFYPEEALMGDVTADFYKPAKDRSSAEIIDRSMMQIRNNLITAGAKHGEIEEFISVLKQAADRVAKISGDAALSVILQGMQPVISRNQNLQSTQGGRVAAKDNAGSYMLATSNNISEIVRKDFTTFMTSIIGAAKRNKNLNLSEIIPILATMYKANFEAYLARRLMSAARANDSSKAENLAEVAIIDQLLKTVLTELKYSSYYNSPGHTTAAASQSRRSTKLLAQGENPLTALPAPRGGISNPIASVIDPARANKWMENQGVVTPIDKVANTRNLEEIMEFAADQTSKTIAPSQTVDFPKIGKRKLMSIPNVSAMGITNKETPLEAVRMLLDSQYAGMSDKEIAKEINSALGTSYNEDRIKALRSRLAGAKSFDIGAIKALEQFVPRTGPIRDMPLGPRRVTDIINMAMDPNQGLSAITAKYGLNRDVIRRKLNSIGVVFPFNEQGYAVSEPERKLMSIPVLLESPTANRRVVSETSEQTIAEIQHAVEASLENNLRRNSMAPLKHYYVYTLARGMIPDELVSAYDWLSNQNPNAYPPRGKDYDLVVPIHVIPGFEGAQTEIGYYMPVKTPTGKPVGFSNSEIEMFANSVLPGNSQIPERTLNGMIRGMERNSDITIPQAKTGKPRGVTITPTARNIYSGPITGRELSATEELMFRWQEFKKERPNGTQREFAARYGVSSAYAHRIKTKYEGDKKDGMLPFNPKTGRAAFNPRKLSGRTALGRVTHFVMMRNPEYTASDVYAHQMFQDILNVGGFPHNLYEVKDGKEIPMRDRIMKDIDNHIRNIKQKLQSGVGYEWVEEGYLTGFLLHPEDHVEYKKQLKKSADKSLRSVRNDRDRARKQLAIPKVSDIKNRAKSFSDTIEGNKLRYANNALGDALDEQVGALHRLFGRFMPNPENFIFDHINNAEALERFKLKYMNQGAKIDQASDPQQYADQSKGRTTPEVEKAMDDYVEPMLDAIKDLGVTDEMIEELSQELDVVNDWYESQKENGVTDNNYRTAGLYMLAKHAPEREDFIKNKGKQGAELKHSDDDARLGIGIQRYEAERIVAYFDEKLNADNLSKLVETVQGVSDKITQVRKDGGLISRDVDSMFEFYVPARGFSERDGDSAGNHTNVTLHIGNRGRTKRRQDPNPTGRLSLPDDPLVNLAQMLQVAIMRKNANATLNALRRLVEGNEGVWANVDEKPAFVTYRAPKGWGEDPLVLSGRVMYEDSVNEDRSKDEATIFYIQLSPEWENMSRYFMPNMHSKGKVEALLEGTRMIEPVMGFLREMRTSKNPAFLSVNLFRDILTGVFNIEMYAPDKQAQFMARVIEGGAAIMKSYTTQDFSGKWGRMVDEYLNNGGSQKIHVIDDLDKIAMQMKNKMQSITSDGKLNAGQKTKEAVGTLMDVIDKLNNGAELVSRVVAFSIVKEAALEAGAKPADAVAKGVHAGRNLTINFNQHGQLGKGINSLYMFWNASIGGTAQILRAAQTSPKIRAQLVAITILGAAMPFILRALMGDDYEKIPDWKKDRNFIIPVGGGNYMTIPLPYGYSWFYSTGMVAADAAVRAQNPLYGIDGAMGWAAFRTIDSFMNNWSPSGSSADMGTLLAPTLLDPILELSSNKDFTGRPIMPEPGFDRYGRESQMYWNNTNPVYIGMADALSSVTGGHDGFRGGIEVSPNALEYATQFVFGGLGKFVDQSITTASMKAESTNDIPIVRSFIASSSGDREITTQYYEIVDRVKQFEASIKEAQEHKDYEKVRRLKSRYPYLNALLPAMKRSERVVNRRNKKDTDLEKARTLDARRRFVDEAASKAR